MDKVCQECNTKLTAENTPDGVNGFSKLVANRNRPGFYSEKEVCKKCYIEHRKAVAKEVEGEEVPPHLIK